MKKTSLLITVLLNFTIYTALAAGHSSRTTSSTISNMQILKQFKSMYEHKHFKKYLFDIKYGYLQTSVGDNTDKMPLNFFVEYNNMWWFSIVRKVEVPSIGYNDKTKTGFIILKIYYGKNHIFRGMQYVKFHNEKISYIRTYASPTFFISNQSSPLVKLDSYGNQFWLTTGYNLKYSANSALNFLQNSPVGQSFASNPLTSKSVNKIKLELAHYLKSKIAQ